LKHKKTKRLREESFFVCFVDIILETEMVEMQINYSKTVDKCIWL